MSNCWIYETGVEIPEILGSGSSYYNIFRSSDFEKVLSEYKKNRDYISRTIFKDGHIIREEYDFDKKEFIKNF